MDESIAMFIQSISEHETDCEEMYYAILKVNTKLAAEVFRYFSTILKLRGDIGGRFWRYCDRNADNAIKFALCLARGQLKWADILDDIKEFERKEQTNVESK